MKKKNTKSIREFEKMISIDFPMDSFIFFSTQTRLYELFYVMIKVFIYSWLTNKHACHATYTYHSRLKMAKIIGGSRIPNNMYYLVLGKHQIYKYSTYLEILWKKNRYTPILCLLTFSFCSNKNFLKSVNVDNCITFVKGKFDSEKKRPLIIIRKVCSVKVNIAVTATVDNFNHSSLCRITACSKIL